MAVVGWRRALIGEDLWALNEADSSKKLVKLWEKIWSKKMNWYWRQKEAASRRDETAQFQANPEEVRIVDGTSKSAAPAQTKRPPAPSIVSAIFLCFWSMFVPATIIKTVADGLQFASPQLLKYVFHIFYDQLHNVSSFSGH